MVLFIRFRGHHGYFWNGLYGRCIVFGLRLFFPTDSEINVKCQSGNLTRHAKIRFSFNKCLSCRQPSVFVRVKLLVLFSKKSIWKMLPLFVTQTKWILSSFTGPLLSLIWSYMRPTCNKKFKPVAVHSRRVVLVVVVSTQHY